MSFFQRVLVVIVLIAPPNEIGASQARAAEGNNMGEMTTLLIRGHQRAMDKAFQSNLSVSQSAMPDEQEALTRFASNPKLSKQDCGAPGYASAFGYQRLLEQFIDKKVTLYSARCKKNYFDHTLLTGAAFNGQLSTVRLLLERKIVSVDETAKSRWVSGMAGPFRDGGETALMLASMEGHVEVVKYLLDHGASPHKKSSRGWQAISYARMRRQDAVIALLVPFDVNMNK